MMMLMKRMALLALVGALVVSLVAGTAVATPGKGNGKGPQVITYVFHGTITAVTPAGSIDPVTLVATTSDTVTVDVEQGNAAAKPYIGKQVTFAVDPADLADVQVGDEVKVQVKAPPNAAAPLTARQLQVKE